MELGLRWASSGLSCSISAYETTSAHLCHSSATGPRPLPPPPPAFTSSLSPFSFFFFYCFKCKINIKFHSCINIRPISEEFRERKSHSGAQWSSKPDPVEGLICLFVLDLKRKEAKLMLLRLSLSGGQSYHICFLNPLFTLFPSL